MTNEQGKVIAWAKYLGGYFNKAQAKEAMVSAADIKALIQSGHLKQDGNTYRVSTPKKAAQVETNQLNLL